MAARLDSIRELVTAGDFNAAATLCEGILEHTPNDAVVLHWLGIIETQRFQGDSALHYLERALAISPDRARWWRDLGVLHLGRLQPENAITPLTKACELDADCAESKKLLAMALFRVARWTEALKTYALLSGDDFDDPEALLGLGKTLLNAGHIPQAHAVAGKLLAKDQNSYQAHMFAAQVCRRRTEYSSELFHAAESLRIRPSSSGARWAYGLACFDTGRLEESLASFRQVIDGGSAHAESHSFYLSVLIHSSQEDGVSLRQEHEAWGSRYATNTTRTVQHPNAPDVERKLRLGYVTGQFITVPTYYFLEPILQTHNRSQFTIFCYHTRPMYDPATRHYQQLADHWRDAQRWTDHELEEAIRSDEIDILVDLSGHYPHGRLNLFARRPAPVQVIFPNYPSTTGVAAFDAIVTDEWTTPRDSEHFYTEPVVRLKPGYLTYAPPSGTLEISQLPARRNGFVTFGTFQRPSKYNAAFWDAVAAVLNRVPSSRVMIHFACADLGEDRSATRDPLEAELSARGVARDRLMFRGRVGVREHLHIVSECDIALDTFPYNGQTTTCECLWMGVPVVTMRGDSHVSRVSSALLARVGLGDWVAESMEQFIEIAVTKAGDVRGLEGFRTTIRSKFTNSICDPKPTTLALEEAYHELWRSWCRRQVEPGRTEGLARSR